VELKEYLYLIWRRKALMVTAFLSVVITAAVFVSLATPLYQADCKLLLVEDRSVDLIGSSTGSDLMLQTLGKSDPISTQMEILKTRPILGKVIDLAGLADKKGRPIGTEELKGQLTVEAVRNTNLISITYRNRDSQRAAAVVNTLARVFIEQNQTLNQEETTSAKEFIETQLAAQQQTLAGAEKKVLDFKKGHELFSLDQEAEGLVNAQAQLEANRMQVETELKGARAQQSDLAVKVASAGAVADRFYTYWTTTQEQVNGQITNLVAQQGSIDRQIAQIKRSIAQLPPQESELARLLEDQKIAGDIYTTLLAKYEEVRVNEAAKIASVRLIEPAVVSPTPVFPRKKQYLLLSAVLGLVLGFVFVLFREHFDDSPHSLAQVREILPYDILGYIPYHKSESTLYLATAPRSPVSEAVRLVRANLKFKHTEPGKSFSVLVTSALPGEGKSTLAVNLSLAFGGSDVRAAIVNLDLRRPAFDTIFDRKMVKGITDFLIGESTLEDIMVGEDGRGVTIVPSGTVPPNPSELVTSKKIPQMMKYLAEHFDVVVYDTPPVTLVAETLDLARYVDGLILVVDMSIATRSALRAMNELISNKNLVILGTVVNNVSRKGASYRYGGAYHYRKGYYEK
jgi:capsular exopolysaccharide synthesis family protein